MDGVLTFHLSFCFCQGEGDSDFGVLCAAVILEIFYNFLRKK